MGTERRLQAARPRAWNEIRLRAVITLASLLIGGVALEGLTRFAFDRHGMHFGIEMWKYATQVKRRSSIAAMGHEHIPNRAAVLMGVNVRTNALGLRDREFSPQKAQDVHRILVLGDSMTFGWGAREEDTYPKVFERLLNQREARYEVINAGVGNYNTVQEVAYFKARGRLLQPDEVILGYFVNDAEPNPSPGRSVLARNLYSYVVASALWDAVGRKAGWKPSFTTYYNDLYNDDSPGWQACREALIELSRLCRRSGVRLTIALIPELHVLDEEYPFTRAHARVTEVAMQEGVFIMDLLPAFAGLEPRSLWVSPGDAHANARGHEIIAGALYRAFINRSAAAEAQLTTEREHD